MNKEKVKKSDVGLQLSIYDLELSVEAASKYQEYVSEIKKAVDEIFEQYGVIGKNLIEVNNQKLYELNGFKNIYEFSKNEFQLSETTTRNAMAVYEKFFVDNSYSISLKKEYEGYTYSALVELLSVSDDEINKFVPTMTVKSIREKKIEIDLNKKIELLVGEEGYLTKLHNSILKYPFNEKFNRDDVSISKIEILTENYTLDKDYDWWDLIAGISFTLSFGNLKKINITVNVGIFGDGQVKIKETIPSKYIYVPYDSKQELIIEDYLDILINKTLDLDIFKEPIKTEKISNEPIVLTSIPDFIESSSNAFGLSGCEKIFNEGFEKYYIEKNGRRLSIYSDSVKSPTNKPILVIDGYYDLYYSNLKFFHDGEIINEVVFSEYIEDIMNQKMKELIKLNIQKGKG